MKASIFITGGSKSGKSTFARERAESLEGRKVFVATALAIDDEMRQRIEAHKRERGPQWDTVEEPYNLGGVIEQVKGMYDVVVVDCLTIWLTNIMLAWEERSVEEGIIGLAEGLRQVKGSVDILVVSNEIGMGIVPEGALSRRFRDHAGLLNQMVAAVCEQAYLIVSGLPLRLK
ncbi:MAG: bifunctional adenosylcobinamide kinase/adenosylcobinamide-phosphate guanylyltransferase [Candidatus Magnetobacterium sp. LHC-1]|uniref:Bifunctional adenosylcobinamide kinase/adenosylcobinamide-phosphate guanylyltransferase n=1 Tax=Candidatus Magnetobacterium casense TaxID=1455061 RepID=A0ABS6RXY5_9BACT|nr:bifunctional adenosylcobinamide kinase/adenosylcobinamide-phosphate guanylyltransferase [Candidatus Magnetobacterium casensis]MBV6341108.1 bifunctional adenosylcobinamide kinase/adenosylcobinamide-phosphate guanylyltransferase [Candidatus Magnetobacterium casensis]